MRDIALSAGIKMAIQLVLLRIRCGCKACYIISFIFKNAREASHSIVKSPINIRPHSCNSTNIIS